MPRTDIERLRQKWALPPGRPKRPAPTVTPTPAPPGTVAARARNPRPPAAPAPQLHARAAPKALTPDARALITGNLPLVTKVAARVARKLPRNVNMDDLKSAGAIGLIEAARTYDPKRSDNFEAFAEFRIRGAMLDDIRSRDTLSRDMRRLSNEIKEATRALETRLGRAPETDEVAREIGIGVDDLHARQQKLSGSTVVGIDDAGPALLERVPDVGAVDPFERVAFLELVAVIETAIRGLTDRERAAVTLRYREGWRLTDIAAAMGYNESRACQVMRTAEAAIRDEMQRAGLLEAA